MTEMPSQPVRSEAIPPSIAPQSTLPQVETASAPRLHLPVLDGIRGLAILMVMQYHFYGLVFGIFDRKPTLMVDRWTARVFGTGWSGVDLFFVLSGFLITGILYDAKSSNSYFRTFYARRVLRIFPLYYVFLLFVLFVLPHLHPLNTPVAQVAELRDTQFWYWTYLVNVGSAFTRLHTEIPLVHSQFWSLAVEEQFYLVWPLVVLLLARRQLMGLCAVLVVAAFVIRIVFTHYFTGNGLQGNAAHVLLPARMDTLALGAFFALAARGPAGELQRYARYAPVVAGVALAVILALFFSQGGLMAFNRKVEVIGYSALALLFVALLASSVSSVPGGALRRLFSSPMLTFLGRYAYGLYVIHLLIAFELVARVGKLELARTAGGSQIPFNLAFSFTATGLSVVLAWLIWHLFEKQVLKLKVFFPYERARTPTLDRALDAPSPEAVRG